MKHINLTLTTLLQNFPNIKHDKQVCFFQFDKDIQVSLPKVAISFCESEELPYLKDIQKLIGLQIPVVKDHPWVTVEGEKAQAGKTEELKEKAKANKVYRGSKSNGDYWRRKKQAQSRQGQGRQSSDRKASGRQG